MPLACAAWHQKEVGNGVSVAEPVDAKENDFFVNHGFRIISSYAVGRAGERVWIITEADRSSTCILLPEESWSREDGAQATWVPPPH
jgi:hypothetical protein